MKCNFQLSTCVMLFLILQLSPDHCGDPSCTPTTGESPLLVRFTPTCLKIHGCDVAFSWKSISHLRRVHASQSLLICSLPATASWRHRHQSRTKKLEVSLWCVLGTCQSQPTWCAVWRVRPLASHQMYRCL